MEEIENEVKGNREFNYFWIRVYDYDKERDCYDKGVMLDEFYLKDVEGGREGAKKAVKEKYCGATATTIAFSKPRKKNGLYAIVMESERFFYDRFYTTVDTFCFRCYKPVKGKAHEFPRDYIGDNENRAWGDDFYSDTENYAVFCNHTCKADYKHLRSNPEGEFQVKEEGRKGDVFGYIYLIYNRAEDTYYIGQTRYMPFFRWQEHVKDGSKGNVCDMSFSVLVEQRKTSDADHDQITLNSLEAWWIEKYQAEGFKVFNIMKPKITLADLKEKFRDMVEKQERLVL